MAISVIQFVQNSSNTSATSITLTLTVTAGNMLHVFACGESSVTNANTLSISDSNGSSYVVLAGSSRGGVQVNQWALPNCTGGTFTITINYATNSTGRGVAVKEISGCSGVQVTASHGNRQDTIGSNLGTDGITSGTVTPTAQPALVSAWSSNTAVAINGTIVAPELTTGTGFSSDGTGWPWQGAGIGLYAESQRITSTSAIAGTFTQVNINNADLYQTAVTIFTEGSSTTGIPDPWTSR